MKTIWKRRTIFVLSCLLCCCIVSYGFLTVYYFQIVPQPKVDYLQQLNRRNTLHPKADHAWPIYRDAVIASGGKYDRFINKWIWLGVESVKQEGRWNEIVADFDDLEMSSMLDEIRRASKKPILGLESLTRRTEYSLAEQAILFGGLRESVAHGPELRRAYPSRILESEAASLATFYYSRRPLTREFVQLLRVDMHMALERGDIERAVEDVEACFGVAIQSSNTKLPVESSIAVKLWGMSLVILTELLDSSLAELNTPQKLRMASALRRTDIFDLHEPWNWVLDNRDRVQRYFSDNGRGDGHLTNDWLVHLSLMDEGRSDSAKELLPFRSRVDSLYGPVLRPFLLFAKPTRVEVETILDFHEQLLRDAWRPPYERSKIEAAVKVISETNLPLGFENQSFYLQWFDEMLDLKRRGEEIARTLE